MTSLCGARPAHALSVCALALSACALAPLGGADAAADAAMDGAATPVDAGAPDAPDAGPPRLVWELPRGTPGAGFELPWPNDLTRDADGTVDLRYLPNVPGNATVRAYQTELAHRIDGFSPVAAAYFRLTAPVDVATLPPEPAATLDAASTLQVVDVDPASPRRGERAPVVWHFHGERPGSRYWPADTLAVSPAPGFPLHARTRYALVVTRALRAVGSAYERDADLDALLAPSGGDVDVAAARALYAPALAELAAAGVPADRVLGLAVFTTSDPTRETYAAIDRVRADGAPPAVLDLALSHDGSAYDTYVGHYGPSPVYQTGSFPFDVPGSGDFTLDGDGIPVQQGTTPIRFYLTVPSSPAPPGGYPIALYAHGTGGDASTFVGDGTAAALAAEGVACMGIDQIFHGERALGAADPSVAFFDFAHPLAARTNNRQAAIDLAQQARMAASLRVPAPVSATGAEVAFDASRISFFGHSQGGLNGPLWVAADPTPTGAVLSGSAGTLTIALLEKTSPLDIASLFAALLGTSRAPEDLVPSHPVLTLAQTIVDVADPVSYVRALLLEPRAGNAPRSVFQTQGYVDTYAPDDAIAADALATGLPIAGPVLHPVTCCDADATRYDLAALGAPGVPLPVHGNFAGGTATGVWMQFDAPPRRDGHFVVFDVPGARLRAAHFLGTLARDGVPTVE